MNYLFFYRGSNNPKNKAESEVWAMLQNLDRMLLDELELAEVQQMILNQVQNINQINKRCTPVTLKFSERLKGDITIFIGKGDTSPVHAEFLKTRC